MIHSFTVAGDKPVDLNDVAIQLRKQIDKLPPDSPQLATKILSSQAGVKQVLVLVRGHELPHTHPNSDLVISVLDGKGYVQLSQDKVSMAPGGIIVIPKGVCHAYHNISKEDSLLFATFSPVDSSPGECP